jgi:uncharacterized membrane protein
MGLLLRFCHWAERTWVGSSINHSSWLFPAIEAVHIVALTLLFGAIVVLNLRLLGLAFRDQPVPELARELSPWTLCSLVIILITGALLFASEATKAYESGPFRIKMVFLLMAILFHFTIYRQVTNGDARSNLRGGKVAAAVSLTLWFGVGWAGRAIGFF